MYTWRSLRPRRRQIAIGVWVVLGIAGCASPDMQAAPGAVASAATVGPVRAVQADRSYGSVQELREASPLIVIVDATQTSDVERVEGVPFTVRTFAVVDVLKGTCDKTIRVGELGIAGEPEATRPSGRYVLFLQPFGFTKGVQYKGQFYAVGGPVGVYTLDGSTARATASERGGMPAQFDVSQARGD